MATESHCSNADRVHGRICPQGLGRPPGSPGTGNRHGETSRQTPAPTAKSEDVRQDNRSSQNTFDQENGRAAGLFKGTVERAQAWAREELEKEGTSV